MNSVKTLKAAQKASAAKRSLPKEALEFARKLGVNMNGLEAEAHDMWKLLEEMSESDPIAYAKFMQTHLDKDALDAELKEAENKPEEKFFRPDAGFVVEMQTCGGKDGMKIREVGISNESGKPLFVNMCSHAALEPPKNQQSGRPIALEADRSTADGLELPLAIGPVREHRSKNKPGSRVEALEGASEEEVDCLVVDVVVHPYVISQCEIHILWLQLTMDLVVEWIEQERGVKIAKNKQGKHQWAAITKLNSTYRGSKTPRSQSDTKYVGGRGEQLDVPVLFPVNYTRPDAEDDKNVDKSASSILVNPNEMIHQMEQLKDQGSRQAEIDSTLSSVLQNPSTSSARQPTSKASEIVLPFQQSHSGKHAEPSASNHVPFGNDMKSETIKAKPKSLVQEVQADGSAAAKVDNVENVKPVTKAPAKGKPKRKPPSIPKGFLNNPKAAGKVYGDEGGDKGVSAALTEDPKATGAAGGSYARFMDRCQVVNVGNDGQMSDVKQPKIPPPANVKRPNEPIPKSTGKSGTAGPTAPQPPSVPQAKTLPPATKPLSDMELKMLDEMYERIDDDYEHLNMHHKCQNNAANGFNDDFTKQLEKLGFFNDPVGNTFSSLQQEIKAREAKEKITAQSVASNPPKSEAVSSVTESSSAPLSSQDRKSQHDIPRTETSSKTAMKSDDVIVSSSLKHLINTTWEASELRVILCELAPEVASGIELQVAPHELVLNQGSVQVVSIKVPSQRHLCSDRARAKYSKKKKTLTVTVATKD